MAARKICKKNVAFIYASTSATLIHPDNSIYAKTISVMGGFKLCSYSSSGHLHKTIFDSYFRQNVNFDQKFRFLTKILILNRTSENSIRYTI